MNDWFVDTSVIVKWILAEADSAQALRIVTDISASGGAMLGLDLATIEATNVIWVRHHRRLLTIAESRQALALLRSAPIRWVPCLPHLDDAFDISLRYDIAVHDAIFIAASRSFGIGGVTADEPLVRAVTAGYSEIKLLRNW